VRTLQTTGLQLFSNPVSFGRKKKMTAYFSTRRLLVIVHQPASIFSNSCKNFFSKTFIFMVRGIVYDMSIIEHLQLPKSERLVLDNEIQQFPSTLTYKRISNM
jgi:hypothetical protein